VLDADIRDFFESLTHEWLVKFVEHRIGTARCAADQKWLPWLLRTGNECAVK